MTRSLICRPSPSRRKNRVSFNWLTLASVSLTLFRVSSPSKTGNSTPASHLPAHLISRQPPIETRTLDANAPPPAGPVLFRGHAPAVAAIPPAVQFAREGDLRVVTAPGCSDGAFRRPDSRF